jgi:hypothetical protein
MNQTIRQIVIRPITLKSSVFATFPDKIIALIIAFILLTPFVPFLPYYTKDRGKKFKNLLRLSFLFLACVISKTYTNLANQCQKLYENAGTAGWGAAALGYSKQRDFNALLSCILPF